MLVGQHNSRQRWTRFVLTVLMSLSCLCLFGQDQTPTSSPKTLLRYRLHRARETALKQENERVLPSLLSASRRLAADWNAVPDDEKLAFVEKCERQLGLAEIDKLPDDVAGNRIPFATPRRESLDVAYAEIEGVDPKLLSLDIYSPKDDKKHPVVVWFHGGGMTGGDKGHPVISVIKSDYFVSQGFLYVSINYRLAPKYKFPAQSQDAAAALAFLHDNVEKYGGDPQRLFLIGNSAGGQLVSILATNHKYLNAHKNAPSIIAGVVVLDIGSFDIPSILDELGERAPKMYFDAFGGKREDWIEASPMFHVEAKKSIPPMLLIYVDGRDHHQQENHRFAAKMKKDGHTATVYTAKERTHNSLAMRIGTTNDPATRQIMEFFQPDPDLSHTRRAEFDQLVVELAQAQRGGDEESVKRLADKAKKLLGGDAGVPETPDQFREVPPNVARLSKAELSKAFDHYLREIKRRKWWSIGEDPTKSEHKPREVASVIIGCCSAYRADCNNKDELLRFAKDAGDYLIWTQEQGGTGVFPFPARQGGEGRVFQIADRFLSKAKRGGFYDEVVRNGWVIDDRRLDEGGLQFDNGECGSALLELYDVTKDRKHLDAARAAADWSLARPCVPNWNYNSFSVYLLAETYRATGDDKYREAAKSKARLGIYPGQLTDGKHVGRWADPHNACLPYHYILIRSLTSLVSVLDSSDPDRPMAIESLRLALKARNPDFVDHGIGNADSAIEALLLLKKQIPDSSKLFSTCGQDAALDALARYSIARVRRASFPLSPGNWGRFVEQEATRGLH